MPDRIHLRAPFPHDRIGLLPKPFSRDAKKGECDTCGKWHGLPALHLDYVGHGAVTERLLDVDPDWSWEPFAVGDDGLPVVGRRGEKAVLWIRLTVLGQTRPGVGIVDWKKDELEKELIGDAIRNAAMRFGVALDLWIKGDKHEGSESDSTPDDVTRYTWSKMRDLAVLVGSKEHARDIWSEAASVFGLSVGDIPADVDTVDAIFDAASVAVAEMRALKVERPGKVEAEFTEEQMAPFVTGEGTDDGQ